MFTKWKSRQRRSEVRTRSSSRRHGAISEQDELLAAFSALDEAGTGSLTLAQMVSLMEAKGYAPDYAKSYWGLSEANSQQAVSVDEFKKRLHDHPVAALESEFARLWRLFANLDCDGCGRLRPQDAAEFVAAAEQTSRILRSEIRRAVDEAGRSEDGVTFAKVADILRARVREMSASEEEILERAFLAFDEDKSGKLGLGEIMQLMERRGYPPIFARVLLDALDADRDFEVTLDEFKEKLRLNPISLLDSGLAELQRIFRLFDRDGSGLIEVHELKAYIKEAEGTASYFGPAISGAINVIDLDRDGGVSFEELAKYLRSQVPSAPWEEQDRLRMRVEAMMSDDCRVKVEALKQLLIDDGYQENFVKSFLDEVDVQNDKTMSFAEFMKHMHDHPIPLEEASKAHLNRAFILLDKEKTGSVTDDELLAYLENPELCADWFKKALQQAIENRENPCEKQISKKELSSLLRGDTQRPLF